MFKLTRGVVSRGKSWPGRWVVAWLACSAIGCVSASPPPGAAQDEASLQQRKASMAYDMGVAHLKEGRTPQAIGSLLSASKLEPDNATIQLALGEAYRREGRMEEAERHLERSVDLNPKLQRARLSLSALYMQLERYEEAREQAAVLVDDATFPWPWQALTNLGWAEYKLGETEKARQHFQLALDYRNDYWRARLNLGIVAADQERLRDALTQFEQVLAESPGPFAEAEVHYRLAELYLQLGHREQAIVHLTEATNRRPSGEWGERSADTLKQLK